MDNLPVQSNQPEAFVAKKPFFNFERGYLIFFILLFLVLIILFLNYQNILPLSKNYPKIFGFLPTKDTIKLASKPALPKKIILSCPVPKEFCKNAKEIPSSGFYMGAGFKLPENTPILAPFDGKFKMVWQEDKEASYSATLQVTEKGGNYSAVYLVAIDKLPLLDKQQVKMRQEYPVKRGQTLLATSAKPVPYRFQEGNNLIFFVHRGEKDDPAQRIYLKPADFLKEYILGID